MAKSSEETRVRILEAAGQLFAEKGYRATSVRDVCGEAGVNLQAVSYHFGDKCRMYLESLRYALGKCHEGAEIPKLPPDLPPEERLTQVLWAMNKPMLTTDETLRPAWCMRLILREMTHPSGNTVDLVEEFIRPKHDVLFSLMRELLPSADEMTHHLAVFSIVGQCLFHRINRPIVEVLLGPRKFAALSPDQIIRHVVRFTLGALRNMRGDQQAPRRTRGGKSRRSTSRNSLE